MKSSKKVANQNVPKCSNMFQEVPKCSKMVQDGPGWSMLSEIPVEASLCEDRRNQDPPKQRGS